MSNCYRVALLGHGIGVSLSPALHMREAECLGLDYEYKVIDLIDTPDADLDAHLADLQAQGYHATNVTHPFKQQILSVITDRSDAVRLIGSTNTVLLGAGNRVAHNTDYSGFRFALQDFLGDRPRGTVLQIGAGGAGLATALALVHMNFDNIVVFDRDAAAAQTLADRFAGLSTTKLRAVTEPYQAWLSRVDGIVHVTPTGMKEHPGMAIDVDLLEPRAWLAEVVYRPLVTDLVRAARERGLATLDGGAMAVGQAVDSLRLITGREPDRARMFAHFNELIRATT